MKEIILEKVSVEAPAAEGKSLVRWNGAVVFITDKVAPNDLVTLRIRKKHRRFYEADVVEIHEKSALRAEPFCQHFGLCGGCKWQHLAYTEQLKFKQNEVFEALTRIGKLNFPAMMPIVASEKTRFYRNKLEFTFSDSRWLTTEEIQSEEVINRNALGFHLPGKFDKILPIETCYLQPDPSNSIRLALRDFAQQNGLTFYNHRQHKGFFRTIIIRTANTGDAMLIVQFGEPNSENITATMQFLKDKFPEITSLQYVINQKGNDTFHDLDVQLFAGKPYIEEKMENLTFRIGAKSFFQTNSEQALKLYEITRNFAALTGNEIVYDLYTGTGTIANFVAKKAKKVVGIEYVAAAIDDARLNSEQNSVKNTVFFAGDMKKVLNENFIAEHGMPDVVITDPPRAGMDKEVIEVLLKIAPQRIVYVSCNPATQARDLALLDTLYAITAIQPVDMFPHTHHVENVVVVEKRHDRQGM